MTKLSFNDLANLRLLLSVEGIGPGKIRNLLKQFRSLSYILSSDYKTLTSVEGISTNLARRIIQSKASKDDIRNKVEEELGKLSKISAKIITVWDSSYPSILKKIFDPPLLLYIIGDFTEQDNYSISTVGTRMPTNYGTIQCEKIVAELAQQNITIVSGLARGIDSIAHRTALKNGSRTIAVIGSGLDVIYPPENRDLAGQIIERGAIISDYPVGTAPESSNFPPRNRIISGLSLAVIVIEAGETSGALITAEFAAEQGREVFAVPGPVTSEFSRASSILLKNGAKLVESADDIIEES